MVKSRARNQPCPRDYIKKKRNYESEGGQDKFQSRVEFHIIRDYRADTHSGTVSDGKIESLPAALSIQALHHQQAPKNRVLKQNML